MASLRQSKPEILESYRQCFEAFEKAELAGDLAWLCPERRSAFTRFAEQGFPSSADEDWHYTKLDKVLPSPAAQNKIASVTANDIEPLILDSAWSCAVFVDGFFSAQLSRGLHLNSEIQITSLLEALRNKPADPKMLLLSKELKTRSLTDLNTALFQDGVYLEVPAGQRLIRPLQILVLFTADRRVSNWRNVIRLQADSSAEIVQTFAAIGAKNFFANEVTEIEVARNAKLKHSFLTKSTLDGTLTARCEARLSQDSQFDFSMVGAQTQLLHHEFDVSLQGTGARVRINGLYLADDDSHLDQSVLIEHQTPGCVSEQLLKGIAGGRSRIVMRGKVHVFKDAQKTNASQTLKNLMLSESAVVDAKPELEILADDVKCSHGTAIGQIDEEALFYLRSRCLSVEESRSLLTRAFALEALSEQSAEPVRCAAETLLEKYLGRCSA